jgi:hypothetical protein
MRVSRTLRPGAPVHREGDDDLVKLRLEGTSAECEQAAALLGQVLDVVSVSDPYPNRGRSRLVRVYVEARLDPERAPSASADRAQPGRQWVTLHRLDRELPNR